MTKRCSFCEFQTDDNGAFDEHMRTVHKWDELGSATGAKARTAPAVPFVIGAVLAFVLNFALALLTFGSRPSALVISVAWLATIAGLALLYRLDHWAAFGALGTYAALFFVLLIAGGATGPYTCFSAYGYPRP